MSTSQPHSPTFAALVAALIVAAAAGCVEENNSNFEIVPASRDGTLSTIILIMNTPYEEEPNVDLTLQSQRVRECPDEEENPETPMNVGLAAGCTLIAPQQVTITGVNPGDITVDVSINGAPRTQLRLLDLRPETTVLVFMERDADGRLSLLAHRRITERFDDFDDNGQWVVEEVDNDG